jgi:hypothetical protein
MMSCNICKLLNLLSGCSLSSGEGGEEVIIYKGRYLQ